MNLEFKTMLLKELYNRGFDYIARDSNNMLFAYKNMPIKNEEIWTINIYNDDDNYYALDAFDDLFPEIKGSDLEPFFIWGYFGEIDWSKVPINTAVYVRYYDNEEWCKRHFAGFDDSNKEYPFKTFRCGKSEWSNAGNEDIAHWKECKLAKLLCN